MIEQFFQGTRTRKQIRLKYSKEEKANPRRVYAALNNKLPVGMIIICTIHSSDQVDDMFQTVQFLITNIFNCNHQLAICNPCL